MPRLITCENPKCRQTRIVRDRPQQLRQRFCSGRCAQIVCSNLTQEARRRGGRVSAQKRQLAAMAKLQDLTKLEIAKQYYQRGWHMGARSARRRLGEVA